jgi:hypothetical protein
MNLKIYLKNGSFMDSKWMVWNWFKTRFYWFKGKKGDKVDKHVHVFSNELTFVLSGEIELITNDGISILKTGQSFSYLWTRSI